MPTTVMQGSTATLVGMFAQYAGGPSLDVDDLTIAITTADGATTVLAATSTGIAHPDTGVYTYVWEVPADQAPGGYLVTWAGTVGGDPIDATELVTVAVVPTYASQLASARRYDRVPYAATDAAGHPIPGAQGTLWDGVAGGNGANQVTNITTLDGTPIPGGILTADARGFYPGFRDLDKTPNLYIIGSVTGVIEGVDPVLIEPSDTDDRVIAMEAYVTGPGGLGDRQDALDTSRGQPGGIATLGPDGRVIPSQLPAQIAGAGGYIVTDYGALGDGANDDSNAIQAVLDLVASTAPGGRVIIPPGTYLINAELEIKSSVWLDLAPGATIKRGSASMQYMLKNFNASYAPTGYLGRGGIRLSGGVWDAAGDVLANPCTAIIFAHSDRVRVENITVRNVQDWHGLEINSSRNVVVTASTFEGFNMVTAGRDISEAVQIDLAKDSGVLPGIGSGAYDNTPCENVTVTGCTTRAYGSLGAFGRLVGSHSFADGVFHKRIRINANSAQALRDYMVNGQNWQDVAITGNTCTSSNGGVRLETPSSATVGAESFDITGNTFRDMGTTNGSASAVSGVISIIGLTSPSSVPAREVVISGNIIKNYANAAAIEVINTADAVTTGNVIKAGTNASAKGIDSVSSANAIVSANKIDTAFTGIHIRDVNSVSGAGTEVEGNNLAACSNTAAQIDSSATTFRNNRVRGSGNASKGSVEVNAGQCMFVGNYVWKNGSGTKGLVNTASGAALAVAMNFFRGWGTAGSVAQSDVMTDNNTGTGDNATFWSSTEKLIATA